jgi:hypothetical protein
MLWAMTFEKKITVENQLCKKQNTVWFTSFGF